MDLVFYSKNNDVNAVKHLLSLGVSVDAGDGFITPLHATCITNAFDVAKLLIDKGANTNLTDTIRGAVPLHYCAEYNCFKIANLILNNGGNLDIADKYGNQPLWTAVFNVRRDLQGLELVKLYLNNGADKYHKNFAGKSPFDVVNEVAFFPLLEVFNA